MVPENLKIPYINNKNKQLIYLRRKENI